MLFKLDNSGLAGGKKVLNIGKFTSSSVQVTGELSDSGVKVGDLIGKGVVGKLELVNLLCESNDSLFKSNNLLLGSLELGDQVGDFTVESVDFRGELKIGLL